ncbi:MAG: TIGR03364 family FAD-dependent oxidoreductase [Flammeovirgaceae bacterium]|jgi:FAD dependent oxidoreductase TIGR03364|nr:TIGR03364 family FAD-dependent oxidoreductase [Flammeovirgaceae bacterium]MCZ8071518.1 TIGR03364 family FAD-dependent oxidoreductase [Cytophagales bacterium]
MKQFDLIVVGSGVLGTFHAYHAAKKGKLVLLLEKDNQPMQATVRNFGQIVPSGMGKEWFQFGVRGTEIYNTIQAEADISIRNNGSVYIASDADEQQLIHELKIEMDTRGYESILLSTSQCIDRWPALKSTYCKEGIFFPQEVSAEPNLLIHRLLQYCTSKFQNFVYQPGTPVVECSVRGSVSKVKTTFGKTYTAEKVIICNGGEFKLLFPELFERSGIKVSKLQMLQTLVMPEVEMEGNILTGLTIRRYESFQECPSYAKLQTPDHLAELKKWGIHLLFKKAIDGSVIIGDSHEYAASYEVEKLGFGQNAYINQLMLAEAQRIVHFDVNKIASSWSGFYPQHNEKDIVEIDIEDRIHIRTAIGGKGMTTSAGYAEQSIAKLI